MPGLPCEHLDHRLVDQLLDLHERRLGLARPEDPVHWPTALIATLTVGGEGYCMHSSLYDFDRRTRSLVERIEAFGYSIDPEELRPRVLDIVHWDLHGPCGFTWGDAYEIAFEDEHGWRATARRAGRLADRG
jgi:hypothetical protein